MTDTIEKLTEHLRTHREDGFCVKPIACKSGLTMSVQASSMHYCSPKSNEGPWTSVEVGYPSKRVAELRPYRETSSPRQRVSPIHTFVPMKVVATIVDKHGGLV